MPATQSDCISFRTMRVDVELVTLHGAVLHEEVDAVTVPTPQGEISILPRHIPLVTTLSAGELRLRRGEDTRSFAVFGGVLEVREGSQVVILTDAAEQAEGISEAAAEEARRRALELRSRVVADEVAFAAATAAVERELARLRIARKYHHRGHRGF